VNTSIITLKRRVTGKKRDTVGYRKFLVPRLPISCPNREIINSVNSALIMQIMPTLHDLAVKDVIFLDLLPAQQNKIQHSVSKHTVRTHT